MDQESVGVDTCPWCGNIHGNPLLCPRLKAVEYWENGVLKRVEFFAPYVPGHEHGPE